MKKIALILSLICLLLLCGCASSVEELSGVMTPEEIGKLDKYKNLKTLDLSGSSCYEEIEAYIASHPEVDVSYTVTVGTTDYSHDTAELDISVGDVAQLKEFSPYLKNVREIKLTDPANGAVLEELRALYPDAAISYSVSVMGQVYDHSTQSLDLSALTSSDVAATAEAIAILPELSDVKLGSLPFDDYAALKTAAPQAHFGYSFELYGKTVTTDDESLEYIGVDIGEAGAEKLRTILPYLDKLNFVYIENCGISNEAMDSIRQACPDKEIHWLVTLGWAQFRTDSIRIWCIGGLNDDQVAPIKYCNKVKYLDLGHNGFTKIDFVYNMPDLEVFIIHRGYVDDITPISSCKNLEYFETGFTFVSDISPLAECTNLVHLNLGEMEYLTDITPIYGLTKLERMFAYGTYNVPDEQYEELKVRLPNCDVRYGFTGESSVFGEWRKINGEFVPRYRLLHEQIGYDWPMY